jgi:glutathione S-transferase
MESLREGHEHIVGGVFREVRPPERLVYTWAWEGAPNPVEMLVSVEFLDRGHATEVVLTHERLPDEKSRREHEKGWTACLSQLERHLAGR